MKIKLLIIFLVIILITFGGYIYTSLFTGIPTDKDATDELYTVEQGMSTDEILTDLEQQGFVRSYKHAYDLVVENDYTFYANTYQISKSNTTIENLEILSNMSSNVDESMYCKLVIVEGDLLTNIASNTAECLSKDEDYVLDYWSDKSNLKEYIANYWFLENDILDKDVLYPLEGYLGAATYTVYDYTTIEDLTYQMLDVTDSYLSSYKDDILNSDYSVNQLMTLASIIEREGMHDVDRPIISGVFYNRLNQQMPLQSDITVLYALGETKEHVLYSDLEVDSPYNTYINTSLPPGPIATPGIPSIEAAIYPQENDYLYFFANQDSGEVYYSETYDEHLAISEEYAWE